MLNTELYLALVELQKSIFLSAIHKNGETKIPIIAIRAPGHRDFNNIKAYRLNPNFDLLSDEDRNKVVECFSSGRTSKDYPLQRIGLKPGCIDSFFTSIRETYVLAVASNPINHYHSFLAEATRNAQSIIQWIDSGTTTKYMHITIQPEINMGQYLSLGPWQLNLLTAAEMSLEAQSSGPAGPEGLSRVSTSLFFKRNMNSMPATKEAILSEVDILILSLWLGIGYIYRTQVIKFETLPWKYAPEDYLPLGLQYSVRWENYAENFELQTFASIGRRIKSDGKHYFPPADPMPSEVYERIVKWMEILTANPKAVYSLNMIADGFRDIARSVGEQSFRKDRIAREGIYKTISGLEGLNTECKEKDKNGFKKNATLTFVACWSTIGEKIRSQYSNSSFSKIPDITLAFRNIYTLRSDLAHSDSTSLKQSLTTTQNSCGRIFNANEVDSSSVGMTLIILVGELLDYFIPNDDILSNLLYGQMPE